MPRWLVLIALAAACGGRKDKPSTAPPGTEAADDAGVIAVAGDAGAGCAPGQLRGPAGCAPVEGIEGRARLTASATRFDTIVGVLRGADALTEAADVLRGLHGSAVWKKAAAAQPGFVAVDVARLQALPDKLETLGRDLAFAAGELRALRERLDRIATAPGGLTLTEVRAEVSTAVSAVFGPRGRAVATTIREEVSPMVSPLVDEIVLMREHVCDRPDAAARAACDRVGALQTASSYLEQARQTARQELDAAGGEVEQAIGPILDGAARDEISRATGKGPGPGEPCGTADLCAWGLACRHVAGAPGTCERTCHAQAMEPCPTGLVCQTLPDLGPVCRPPR